MDHLLESWNTFEKGLEKESNRRIEKFSKESTGLLLERLKRTFRMGLYWNAFFMLCLIVLSLFHLEESQILLLIGSFLLLLTINLLYSGLYYFKMKKEPVFTDNTRVLLVRYYKRVSGILRFERIWSLFAIPLGLLLAVLYSQLRSYGSFHEMVFEPKTLLAIGILLVTLVPLVIIWVVWSQKIGYKKDLTELQDSIRSLEA
jgi:magnesium-transporting ATPase (P-type)